MEETKYSIKGIIYCCFVGLYILAPGACRGDSNTEFLIGWYSGIEGKDLLAGYASKGVNIMMPYTNGNFEKNSREQHVGPYLKEAERCNIKILVEPNRDWLKKSDWKALKNFVNKYRDYSAVYGWYLYDEPELNDIPPDRMQNAYKAVKEADPTHPVAVVFAGDIVSGYYRAFDILIFDRYPCYKTTPEFGGISEIKDVVEDCMKIVEREKKKGFIMALQGYGIGNDGKPQFDRRDPTYAEQRYMIYTSIVRGVMGILFFADYRCCTPELKRTMDTLIREVSSLGKIIPKGKFNDHSIKCNTGSVKYRYCTNGNEHYLIAVNDSSGSSNSVKFTLPFSVNISQVEVLNETRKLSVNLNSFSDSFSKYGVHIYRF